MKKNNLYRTLIIAAVLLFTVIYDYPTIGWLSLSDEAREQRMGQWKDEDSVYVKPTVFGTMAKSIRRWANFDRTKVVTLGLDLQGGVHMVVGFKLSQEQIDRKVDEKYVQDMVLQRIRRRIDEFEAKDPIIQALGKNQIQIQLPGEKDIERAKNLIKKTAMLEFNIVSGFDQTTEVFSKIEKDSRFAKRFTPFLHPPTMRGGQFRVPVEYADQIRAVLKEANEIPELVPADKMIFMSEPPKPGQDQEYELYLLNRKPLMTGEKLTRAMAAADNQNPGKYQILFEFSSEGGREFGEATGANIGNPMAIVLDGVVCSAPTIRDKIGRNGQITGNFDAQQANDLAIALNSGSMPVPLYEEYTGVVGPGLGTDSIRQGIVAATLGLLAVIIFMLVYYRFGGLIANVGLFLHAFIMLAFFSYFRLTLTLPGIAGFVLTLGMAVDANVLIFERVREEVRNGKSLISAIELGYKHATVTIVDTNLTTMIAALVLLQYGTGPVQGFGVALAVGLSSSVFTALIVTKAIFDVLISRKMIKKLTMMSVIKPDTKIPFIGMRRITYTLSVASIVFGALFFFGRGYENNFGVDFASGTNIVIDFDTKDKIDIGNVRQRLADAGFANTVVQNYGAGGALQQNVFMIRTSEVQTPVSAAPPASPTPKTAPETAVESVPDAAITPAPPAAPEASPAANPEPKPSGSAEEQPDAQPAAAIAAPTGGDLESRVKQALAPLSGPEADPGKVILEKVESVGPAIGSQLRMDAVKAVAYAFIFMIAFLWFRYSLVFGIAGVIALIHDTLFTCGMLAITGRHIDMNVVAAILTIIGYSINDTVVVYDRIRENMRLYVGRGFTYGQIMDMAINQTLSRTLLTSVITSLTVIMMFFFGGRVLNDFCFYLIIGIVVGTYSSVFVASTLAYTWHLFQTGRVETDQGKGPGGGRRTLPKKGGKAPEATA